MNKTYTLTDLTETDINVIAGGLQEVAFKFAAPMIAKMKQQIEAQNQTAAGTPPVEQEPE